MPWPLSQDYNEAVQNPESSFADPELRAGEVATNAMGLPMPCSGNFADVYRFHCPATNRSWAVKCFTRQIPGLQERYQQISRHLEKGKPSFIVDFTFLDRGIQVRGAWYPILKMQWVEGLTLNQFVKGNLDKPQVLDGLCQLWAKLAVRLREANIAHCDLQHGNVLLVPGKAGSVHVRLVDYDGMCVPALTLLKPMEVGHPSYQHPQRQREGIYNLEVDRFSHLVIYTALRSLMVGGKALWDRYDDGDNLLFRQADFEAPAKSRLFYELLKLEDTTTRYLAEQMIEAVRKPLDQTPLLEDLVGATQPAAVRVQPAAVTSRQPTAPEPAPSSGNFAPIMRAAGALPRGQKAKAGRDRLRWYGVACAVGLLGMVVGGVLIATRGRPETKPGPTGLAAMATRKTAPAAKADPQLKPAVGMGEVVIDPKTTPKTQPISLPPRFTNSLGMEFALVGKGTAWLGGGGGKPGNKEVEIPHDFYLGVYEVTQGEWHAVMGVNPSHFSRTGAGKDLLKGIPDADLTRFPVEMVSWEDAQLFVTQLNARVKEAGWLYRLPTEAEWEYACRGGPPGDRSDGAYNFYAGTPTDQLQPGQANFKHERGLNRTCQVGSYPPNRLGLYDMHGNVWEWCDGAQVDPKGASQRVYRGGAFSFDAQYCRAAARYLDPPSNRDRSLGLRVARVPVSEPSQPRRFTNSLGMEFALVPKGKSWLDGGGGKPGEREVEIPHDFYLEVYPVTQLEWQKLIGPNPSHFSRTGGGKELVKAIPDTELARFPVENVSWFDAQAFLTSLNARANEKGWLYRLPTEAEWEYACRGGPISKEESGFDFYFHRPSNDLSSSQANFNGNYPAGNASKGQFLERTTKVGSYLPNRLGIYDMHGNLWQWCEDSDEGSGSVRVIHGGSWNHNGSDCRAARRDRHGPATRSPYIGFRLARIPLAEKPPSAALPKPAPGPQPTTNDLPNLGKWEDLLQRRMADAVYLSDMPEIEVSAGEFAKKGNRRVGGKLVPNGILLHPPIGGAPATVSYRLEKQFRAFACGVAVSDNPNKGSSVPLTFVVVGDGKVLWSSNKLQKNWEVQLCCVSVRDLEKLTLRVESGQYVNSWAHASWIEPQVLKELPLAGQ